MKRVLAVVLSFLLLGALRPGQQGVTQGLCGSLDPVMEIIKAAERSIEEANVVSLQWAAAGECFVVTVPVTLEERLYATKDATGAVVEVWRLRIIGGGDTDFYMWVFPQLAEPSGQKIWRDNGRET